MRLIDADEVMAILPEENVDARMAVLFAPTVDPVTHETALDFLLWEGWLQEHDRILTESAVKHGRWIEQEHGDWRYSKEYRCSECGKYRLVTAPVGCEWHYCPNCGAKMDEEG
jgi:predicted RNA-binding Zn-ribbon protein involved in translation (DUF1610 family)